MFTRFDKAGGAAIGGALATIVGTLLALGPEQVSALAVALAGLLGAIPAAFGAYLPRNKE